MSRLADPKILMAIKDLPLAAKTTVDGFLAGLHTSHVKGVGMEFSQYRSYQAGDDLRRLDWKMFARSDRYYIRESEIETSISVRIIVDASASMLHEDDGFTKIEYARYMAASLAYLAKVQGDTIGLYILQDGELVTLPARNDSQHLARIFYQLEKIDPSGHFTGPGGYKDIISGSSRRELVIFITDYYETDGEITKMIRWLSEIRHELIVLHVMGRNEMNMDYGGYTSLEDLETGEVVRVDPGQVRKIYTENLGKYLEHIRSELLNRNVFYERVMMNEPLEKVLTDFLKHRNKRGR
jgi:uncharacterized protein (DUF58 family)